MNQSHLLHGCIGGKQIQRGHLEGFFHHPYPTGGVALGIHIYEQYLFAQLAEHGGDIDGGYECSVYWDDSVIEDKAAQIERDILLLSNGLKSKLTIMTTTLGMTEEQAEAEIKRIADESRIGALDTDRFAAFAVT